MKVAALDLGTNTFLMLIGEVEGQSIRVLRDELRVTRLGQGVNANRRFHPEALARAEQCFSEYRDILNQMDVQNVVAVATSAARDVSNKEEFFSIADRFRIPVRVISGDREAELTFLGSTFDRKDTQGTAVIDIGGGSTEIVSQSKGRTVGKSINIGSVRLTEQFVSRQPVPRDDMARMSQFIVQQIESAQSELPIDVKRLIAVAGTPTTLAAVAQAKPYSDERVHGYILRRDWLEDSLAKMAAMSVEDRQRLPGMDPKRADVLVAGTMILIHAMKALNVDEIEVSTHGVRYGVALKWREILGPAT